jgi:hypothetical protein
MKHIGGVEVLLHSFLNLTTVSGYFQITTKTTTIIIIAIMTNMQ